MQCHLLELGSVLLASRLNLPHHALIYTTEEFSTSRAKLMDANDLQLSCCDYVKKHADHTKTE
jgi:hypothetical protein